ncbi:MAG: PEP-CTERM sorting domain-containing protein [Planctomycetales bacterium]|nr:PEP-CTERM sorting domain-containing protein [Planctomycetales bacterium]
MRCFWWSAMMLSLGIALTTTQVAQAAKFYPIDGVTVDYPPDAGGALWPESNMIQGPGLGYDANEPHDKTLSGANGNWVTDACGAGCSYLETFGAPTIYLDLGTDRELNEISIWGYEASNANGLRDFSLRFATDADGPSGYGTTVSYAPDFTELLNDTIIRQSMPFTQAVTARYVELTPLENFWIDAEVPGGDRVGIGEIAFEAPDDFVIDPPPEPSVKFYPIAEVTSSTQDTDFYPVEQLIEGPGVGFLNQDPFPQTGALWVTEACGFPCDYLDGYDPPEVYFDLGEDVLLSEIDIWGYASSNANGVTEFSLSFATDADGPDGYGSTIAYNPTFSDLPNNSTDRMPFPFDENVTARYVRLTALDNFFEEPGDGSNGETPGGDRVGLGEVAFPMLSASLPGDFDQSGTLDVADIDALSAAVLAGNNPTAYDVNTDGSVDDKDLKYWIEDLFDSWVGDSNLDKEFNSSDLVAIFQEGKFETGAAATWAQGDWTGDGVFDSSDFVAAFQGGGFEQGVRAAVSAVPEPSSIILLGIGTLLIARRRRA